MEKCNMSVRYRTNNNFILRQIAGEAILVAVGPVDQRLDNCVISMNDTSAFLWQRFSQGPITGQEAVAAAKSVYHAPDGIIEAHVQEFVETYAGLGLLEMEE